MSSKTNFQATLSAPHKKSWPYKKIHQNRVCIETGILLLTFRWKHIERYAFFENFIIYKLHIGLFNLISRYLVEA